MHPINFVNCELDTLLAQWFQTNVSRGLLSVTIVSLNPLSELSEPLLLAQFPPVYVQAAQRLTQALASQQTPPNAPLAPLVSWHGLHDGAQTASIGASLPTWQQAWQHLGAEAYLQVRFPLVAGRFFECYLMCKSEQLEQPVKTQLVWSLLSLWPRLVHLLAKARNPLSPREHQCLAMSFEGLTARKVGERLGTSERTVNFHIANAMAKLGAGNKLEAVRRACWMGLL